MNGICKVIRGGRLLDARDHNAPYRDIVIEGDTIVAVGPPEMEAPAHAFPIDARRRLLHPGLINAHTHGHGVLGKGMGDRWTLEALLCAGPWLNGSRLRDDKYLSTYVGAIEMLMKGCTACYDLTVEVPYPTADGLQACADAYGDAGMRAVLAPMIADRTFYQAIPGLLAALPHELRSNVERMDMPRLDHCLAVMREVVGEWRHDRDLVRPAIAPTIPHHCSDEFLMGCGDFAREFDLGLHSHVQESKVQVMAGLESYGKTQTAHLSELRLLGPNFTAAHGVWFDRDDMRLLADAGASVAHNPGSNMRLGNGIADIRGMLDAGINVGIGTDGPSSSDNLNMYEAMRFASFSSKSRGPDTSAWLTTEEVFEAATLGSAKALGLQGKIGRIAAGHKADIVFIDLDHPNWMPFNDPTNQLVHVEDGTAVHSVMVAGEMRVEDHRPVGVDLARLASRVDQVRERLDTGRGESKRLCEALSPVVNEYCSCLARRAYPINRYSSGEYLPG